MLTSASLKQFSQNAMQTPMPSVGLAQRYLHGHLCSPWWWRDRLELRITVSLWPLEIRFRTVLKCPLMALFWPNKESHGSRNMKHCSCEKNLYTDSAALFKVTLSLSWQQSVVGQNYPSDSLLSLDRTIYYSIIWHFLQWKLCLLLAKRYPVFIQCPKIVISPHWEKNPPKAYLLMSQYTKFYLSCDLKGQTN